MGLAYYDGQHAVLRYHEVISVFPTCTTTTVGKWWWVGKFGSEGTINESLTRTQNSRGYSLTSKYPGLYLIHSYQGRVLFVLLWALCLLSSPFWIRSDCCLCMSRSGFPWVHFGLGPKFAKAARIGTHLPHTATNRYGPVNCDVLSKYSRLLLTLLLLLLLGTHCSTFFQCWFDSDTWIWISAYSNTNSCSQT